MKKTFAGSLLSVIACFCLEKLFWFSQIKISSLTKQKKWHGCPECCVRSRNIVSRYPHAEANVMCFDFGSTENSSAMKYLYHTSVTHFDPIFSFYLKAAQDFLYDVDSKEAIHGEVIWRLEDNSTIDAGLLVELNKVGVAVAAHSRRLGDDISARYTILFPNFHFIHTKAFRKIIRRLEEYDRPFLERTKDVFWAGSTTGFPSETKGLPSDNFCDNLLRVKLVRQHANVTWLNFAITKVVQHCSGSEEMLRRDGLMKAKVPEETWIRHRGILDIDGNVDAWGLRWRLASGSVVFRVRSSYESYTSQRLIDGVHYVELSPDFTDLDEKLSILLSDASHDIKYLEGITRNSRTILRDTDYASIVHRVAMELRTRNDIEYPRVTP